jgi:hypothetical protein
LEKGDPLHLNKLETPLPKDDLCQVWLKLAQWFWRRSRKCKSLQTDGQTDGQPAIRIAHLSFQLRWAKNIINEKFSIIPYKKLLQSIFLLSFFFIISLLMAQMITVPDVLISPLPRPWLVKMVAYDLPLVSNVLTWSWRGMVLSCVKDNTLLGIAGFSLRMTNHT